MDTQRNARRQEPAMTRVALALATLMTLTLNGSMAVASMPGCAPTRPSAPCRCG